MPAPPPPGFDALMQQKYALQGQQVAGEYERNIAESQLRGAQAGTELRTQKFFDNPDAVDMLHDRLLQRGIMPSWMPGTGAPGAQGAPAAPAAPTQSTLAQGPQQQQWSTPDLRKPPSSLVVTNPFSTPNLLGGSSSNPQRFRKGSTNVKAPPGKAGSGRPLAGGPPKGLEAMLPMLLAAMQGGQAGSPAGPPAPPGAAGGPAPGGLKKGSANVKAPPGKGSKSGKAGGAPNGRPLGLESILPSLLAASQASQMGGGAVGPQAPQGGVPSNGRPLAPGAAAPPGFAMGMPDVEPNPGYPFGAGYLFGKTAVPGRGPGTVDRVPALLAPHEAVLNRAAADSLGRGKIAALNAAGTRAMGLRRGTARV